MKSHFVYVRNFKDANFTDLLSYLSDVDWYESFNSVCLWVMTNKN